MKEVRIAMGGAGLLSPAGERCFRFKASSCPNKAAVTSNLVTKIVCATFPGN